MAKVAAPVETEEERVYRWRTKRLQELGIDDDLAVLFAVEDVDLHRLADLIAAGCEPLLALKIMA